MSKIRINIFHLALGAAILLNIDKIIFGPFAPVRCYDTFDNPFTAIHILLRNILKYGLISQSPENLCGVSYYTFAVPPNSLPIISALLLPPYLSYLSLSISLVFIAFLGIFLLLRDDFKLSQKASAIGALFFSSITIHLPLMTSVIGIPLLIWSFERIFDSRYRFSKRLFMYLYILIYFMRSSFVIIAPQVLLFYLIYSACFSNIKNIRKNILAIVLIWSLFVIVNLPSFAELFFHLQASHKNALQPNLDISWVYAAKYLIKSLFNIHMHDFYIVMPSLLGLTVILAYIFSSERQDRDKCFYFPIIFLVIIEIVAFFLSQTPIWNAISERLVFLKYFRLERFAYLLIILFSILIGQSSDFLIKRKYFAPSKAWYLPFSIVFLYIGLGIIYRQFPFYFFDRTIDILRASTEFIFQLLSVLIFLLLISLKTKKGKRCSIFTALFISFLFFALANTLHSRFSFGTENFQHYYRSPQIERVKAMEGYNLENFRVADVGGANQSKLLNSGFKCADGHFNIYPESYKEFWIKVIEPAMTRSKKIRDYYLGDCNRVYLFYDGIKNKPIRELSFNPDLLRLINVKYIFSDEKILDCGRYGLIETAAKSDTYVKASLWRRYFSEREFYVYQNRYFAAPVFLTGSFDSFDTKEELLDKVSKKDYDYLVNHTFVLNKDAEALFSVKLDVKNAIIKDYKLSPDEIKVWLHNQDPVILNWSTNYNKNWICEIDGKRSPVFRIYNTFMGVVVPRDSNIAVFKYENTNLNWAYLMAGLGFLIVNIYVIRRLRSI